MTRQELQDITIGQTGLYDWDKSYPVVRTSEPREVLYGESKGSLFRYIEVASSTGNGTIGFIVREG